MWTWFASAKAAGKPWLKRGCSRGHPFHPGIEALEGRALPSTATTALPPGAVLEKSGDILVKPGTDVQKVLNAVPANSRILLEPGTYAEALTVSRSGIQIVGLGDGVVLQNPGHADTGITVNCMVTGFVLQNVTVRDFRRFGVFLEMADHYLLLNVTSINNREDGLFGLASNNGLMLHCRATGSSDIGIYVGQSTGVTVRDSVVYGNVNGIEVEDSSHVTIRDNVSYDNVLGISLLAFPDTDFPEYAKNTTADQNTITGNFVYANNHANFGAPGTQESQEVPGVGILVVGADGTTVRGNHVAGNQLAGIGLLSAQTLNQLVGFTTGPLNFDTEPDGTHISDNAVIGNGTHPPAGFALFAADLVWDASGTHNLWDHNVFLTAASPTGTLPSK